MSWDEDGNLYCNCCYGIVIPKDKVTKKDLKKNIGKTFCTICREKFSGLLKELAEEHFKDKRRSYET